MAAGWACSVDPQVLFYSEAGRSPRPLLPGLGARTTRRFTLLRNPLSFVSYAPSLCPPISLPSGSGKCRSPRGGGGGVVSDKSLTLAAPPEARVVGLTWGGLYCTLRCVRPDSPKPRLPRHAPRGARSCVGACPHLTPILPLRYFSMTGVWSTLPTGEGAGVISTQFISSFRSAGSPALRAAGPRLGRSGAFIIMFK